MRETGEAEPELKNIRQLAPIFHVSLDYLLSEEPIPSPCPAPANPTAAWIDRLPKTLGKLFRRFGWLAGVYIAILGGIFTAIGAISRASYNNFVKSYQQTQDAIFGAFPELGSDLGSLLGNQSNSFLTQNPMVTGLSTLLLILGIGLMIVGIYLAWKLKKLSKEP